MSLNKGVHKSDQRWDLLSDPLIWWGPTSAEVFYTCRDFTHCPRTLVQVWWRCGDQGFGVHVLPQPAITAQEPSPALAQTWHPARVKSRGGGEEKTFF